MSDNYHKFLNEHIYCTSAKLERLMTENREKIDKLQELIRKHQNSIFHGT